MIRIKLKDALSKKGKDVVWLSDQTQVRTATLYNFANKKTTAVEYITLDAICRTLKCQPKDLLEWTDEPEPTKEEIEKTKRKRTPAKATKKTRK